MRTNGILATSAALTGVLAASCASIIGAAFSDYVIGARQDGGPPGSAGDTGGGGPGGGSRGAGAAIGRGGIIGAGGINGGGGVIAGAGATVGSCGFRQKLCGGVCTSWGPTNGCESPSCSACTSMAPPSGILSCSTDGQCDFTCLSGFTRSGAFCVSTSGAGGTPGTGGNPGTGGAPSTGGNPASGGTNSGGAGGAAGSGGVSMCGTTTCANACLPFYETRCCTTSGTCGCKLVISGTCQ